jgi:hypothetical protein
MGKKLITVGTFDDSITANTFKSVLESKGIESYLQDEMTVNTNYLYANAIGSIKLQVEEDDYERAAGVLRENPSDVDFAPDVPGAVHCPECGSENVTCRKQKARINGLMILTLGFPLVYPRYVNSCGACGREWKTPIPKTVTVMRFVFYLVLLYILVSVASLFFS